MAIVPVMLFLKGLSQLIQMVYPLIFFHLNFVFATYWKLLQAVIDTEIDKTLSGHFKGIDHLLCNW
jgi:hypothetical protein